MVRDEPDDRIRPAVSCEVQRAVEGVEPGADQRVGAADVVQPGGADQEHGVDVVGSARDIGSRTGGAGDMAQAKRILGEEPGSRLLGFEHQRGASHAHTASLEPAEPRRKPSTQCSPEVRSGVECPGGWAFGAAETLMTEKVAGVEAREGAVVNEWIARVMPLPLPIPSASRDSLRRGCRRCRNSPASGCGSCPRMCGRGRGTAARACMAVDLGPVRLLAVDSANPAGGVGGSLDSDQAAWLVRQLQAAADRYVVVASHDSSLTMTSDRTASGAAPRILGAEVASILLAHRCVVAWVAGTMHHRTGRRHGDASHGFWELPGAADGRDAPLAGGLSVGVRRDRPAVVLRAALAHGPGSGWEAPDPHPGRWATAADPTVRAAVPH